MDLVDFSAKGLVNKDIFLGGLMFDNFGQPYVALENFISIFIIWFWGLKFYFILFYFPRESNPQKNFLGNPCAISWNIQKYNYIKVSKNAIDSTKFWINQT